MNKRAAGGDEDESKMRKRAVERSSKVRAHLTLLQIPQRDPEMAINGGSGPSYAPRDVYSCVWLQCPQTLLTDLQLDIDDHATTLYPYALANVAITPLHRPAGLRAYDRGTSL